MKTLKPKINIAEAVKFIGDIELTPKEIELLRRVLRGWFNYPKGIFICEALKREVAHFEEWPICTGLQKKITKNLQDKFGQCTIGLALGMYYPEIRNDSKIRYEIRRRWIIRQIARNQVPQRKHL